MYEGALTEEIAIEWPIISQLKTTNVAKMRGSGQPSTTRHKYEKASPQAPPMTHLPTTHKAKRQHQRCFRSLPCPWWQWTCVLRTLLGKNAVRMPIQWILQSVTPASLWQWSRGRRGGAGDDNSAHSIEKKTRNLPTHQQQQWHCVVVVVSGGNLSWGGVW